MRYVSARAGALGALALAFTLACGRAPSTGQGSSGRAGAAVLDPQPEALARLREESRQPVVARFVEDRLRFASFEVAVPGGKDDTPAQRAMAFLEEHAQLLGLASPRDTFVPSRIVHGEGGDHVFFDQRVGPVPIFGAQLAVHLVGDRAVAVNGDYLTEPPPPAAAADPNVLADDAVERALKHAGGGRLAGAPKLAYFDWRLLYRPPAEQRGEKEAAGPRRRPETRLAWRLTVVTPGGAHGWDYFVDARDGAILTRLPTDHDQATGKDFLVRTANNFGETIFCGFQRPTDWFTEAGQLPGTTPDAEGFTAFSSVDATWDFFQRSFAWPSWDGRGREVRVILDDFDFPLNAAYVGLCGHFIFGNNMVSRDVIAHEFTHGVTARTAGLLYAYQSGALNESYSDVFGAMVDTSNWTIGEGTASAALNPAGVTRSLANPPVRISALTVDCGPLPPFTGCIAPAGPQAFNHPDRMSQLIANATNDVGGDFGAVHANTGVTNKAAFLIAAGGKHNGVTTVGIGRPKTAQLYFEVLTSWLTYNADFQGAADATILVAQAMARAGRRGFTAADACTVQNAFAAVELAQVDSDCDGVPDANDPDDDADGVPDSSDNCLLTANPGQADRDGDGLGDACDDDADADGVPNASDDCPLAANPGQADLDRDGYGDACDDSDGDGVLDATDGCTWVRDPAQRNTDGDRWGDACDADADGDGYCQLSGPAVDPASAPAGGCPTASDDCPFTPDPSQSDGDGDGRGDACDRCPAVADEGRDTDRDGVDDACDPDDDGDGVVDTADNCPLIRNADQRDFNGNGVGSACDPSEQIVVGPGRTVFGMSVQQLLERNQIVELPLLPRRDLLELCDWPGSGRALRVSISAGAPFAGAIVDDGGRFVGRVEAAGAGVIEFVPGADLCALPVPKSGAPASLDGALRDHSYSLQLLPLKPFPRGSDLKIGVELVEPGKPR